MNPMRHAGVVPIRIDLSALVRRSVASLYSHLVTRPTGQALRLGIERQIQELGSVCVSILDFAQVVVLDYSCADEAVAKLVRRYMQDDRPTDAYFVARGVDDHHRETLEAVLARHEVPLVADVRGQGYTVLPGLPELEAAAWEALHALRFAGPAQIAAHIAVTEAEATVALENLAAQRLVIAQADGASFLSLPALVGEA